MSRTPMRSAKSLSQTDEMIVEDLYGTQARGVYEMGPYGGSHDRESEARGDGTPVRLRARESV